MLKLIPLAYFTVVIVLSSCATYRTGQTPDDVYMAADPEIVSYVDFNQNNNREHNSGDNRPINMQFGNHQFNNPNNLFFNNPRRIVIFNNQFFGLTNGGFIPFMPVQPIKNTPIIQNNPSVISNQSNPRTINYGKFSAPEYQNGSSAFPKGNNRNDIEYPSSQNNGGSRSFQNNSSSNSSGGSGTAPRSGRRN